jgi:hypothetical protein
MREKIVEKGMHFLKLAGNFAYIALQKGSRSGGCVARLANLGGGGHPVAQSSWRMS